MSFLGGLMRTMQELEDFPIGAAVLTPSGRRARVVKHLSGASKRDAFTRLICRYEGGGPKDLVTLQPHQLRLAEPKQEAPLQMGLAFA